jgi:uncharacterized metal-binding protein (TIGR02443 family)
VKRARFVAGAVCPACGASDRIVLEERDGTRIQRCVACRHEERIDMSSDESEARLGDESVAIVKIVPRNRGD